MFSLRLILSVIFLVSLSLAPINGKAAPSTKRRSFGQLPTTLSPSQYHLSIRPYFPADGIAYPKERNFTFDANLTISINCLDDTDNITLHMNQIELDRKSIYLYLNDVRTKTPILVMDYSYDNESQQVVFPTQTTLRAGRSYELHMKYRGLLDAGALAGFYPSSYFENGQKKWLVVTQLEPIDARRVIPSFDEPFYKASFNVNIIHPTSMIALSNTMEIRTEKMGNGWSRTEFEPSLNMSTYLLSMAICDFRSMSKYTADKKTLFRVWARPSFIDKLDFALSAGPKVLDYYSKYFEIPFPLKKQDMLALPDFVAGAMENWGLVTYREVALLYDDKISTPNDKLYVALVIAHELGHQWFGDLVTMNWWDDLWLNEGFATYLEHIGTDVISDDKFKKDIAFAADSVSSGLSLDSLWTSHPIFVPVSSPDDINGIFDSISYHKGASIIRMLNYTISTPLLRKGLQIYLTKHKYKNANHNDLWAAFTEAVQQAGNVKDWNKKPLNVSDFLDPWVRQMGYPVLNVTRLYGGTNKIATFEQKHFLLSEKVPENARAEFLTSPYNFTWHVPIWYQNADMDGDQSAWLVPQKTLTIYTSKDDQWLLVNYERAAFCRVNYDEKNWRLLVKQLTTDHHKIHVKNRIGLLDDSAELARVGQLSYEIALDMTLYLHSENDYSCWGTALESLTFIQNMLALTPSYEDLKDYIAALTSPLYTRLGWDDSKESVDDLDIHNLRAVALKEQCWVGIENCTQSAKNEFAKFVLACSDPKAVSSECSPIRPNLRKVIYCEGGKDDQSRDSWALLWKLHAAEQLPAEKQRLMYGLACTTSPALIYQILNEAIAENPTVIRRQDGPAVFSALADNDVARPLLWPFIEQNWKTVRKLYAQGMLGLESIFNAVTASFNTEDKLVVLRKFYDVHYDQLGTAKRAFARILEVIESNVDWMRNNHKVITDWLKKQPLPVPPRKRPLEDTSTRQKKERS